MVVAIKKYGLGARIYDNCQLKDIEYWIKHHIPVIVDWFAGGSNVDDISMGHSSVVVDIDRESVYLMDPSVGQISSFKREEFRQIWFDWAKDHTISPKNLTARHIIVVFPKKLIE
jgi:predicted double-glycine peptidase